MIATVYAIDIDSFNDAKIQKHLQLTIDRIPKSWFKVALQSKVSIWHFAVRGRLGAITPVNMTTL